jgi:hypothetical protein
MRAVVAGTPDIYRTDYREKGFGAHFLEPCRAAARTGNRQVLGIGLFELQQLRQGTGPGAMHRGRDSCLDTLQIESSVRFAVAENDAQQLLYFAGDFLLNRFGRFFPGLTAQSQLLAAVRRSVH